MIITRTPFRISFVGGGTDLKEFYSRSPGNVVSVSINKHVYLSMHPYFHQKKYFLKYSSNELVGSVRDIKHRIIKQVFQDYKVGGVDFNSSADVPSGTGLGSSSAFTVGLINLCNAYTGKYMSKEKMAEYASQIEIERLGEPIGKQDQYASALGGLNHLRFNTNGGVSAEKIILRGDKYKALQDNLMLFYTGDVRSAGAILAKQKYATINDARKFDSLRKLSGLAETLKAELLAGNIDALGEILHEGWMLKKSLTEEISNPRIDHYYGLALKNGALGGKLLGAGGGGFLLFYVKPSKKGSLRRALKGLGEYLVGFDDIGTTVAYYS